MINGRKFGFYANGTFQQMPIEQTCEVLSEIGYDAIELDKSWFDRCTTDKELSRQLDVIHSFGMELSELIVQHDYVDPDPASASHAVEETIRHMKRCADVGIGVVNLFTGPRPWIPNALEPGKTISLSRAWDMVFQAFDRIVPAAEELNVHLAVENVWAMMCHDFYSMKFLVTHYNSTHLGVNFDPSHDVLAGNRDMEFLLKQWNGCIKHIHLKDAAGTQTKGNVLFPPLGEGFVDWEGFRRGLDAIAYKGVLSVEYEADQHLMHTLKGDWIMAARESYESIKKIFG